MADKKLTKEQVEALKKCKTKEEVEKFAKDNDQLTEKELEQIVGGRKISVELLKALIATGGLAKGITGDIIKN